MPTPSEALSYIPTGVQVAGAWTITAALAAAVFLHVTRHRRLAPGDRPPRRTAENLIVAVAALFIAGIGFAISFESVSTMAYGWAECAIPPGGAAAVCTGAEVWQRWPWALPLAIDVSIIAFDYIDLWLIRRGQELTWLRFVPRIGVLGTIFLNAISASTWGDRIAHVLLMFNYAVLAHVLRHAMETERNGGKLDRVDTWQWALAPRVAYGTWRIMRLEKLSWEAATEENRRRTLTRFWLIESNRPKGKVAGNNLHRVAVWLRGRFSRGWSYVPAADRVRFRMRDFDGLGRVAKEISAGVAVPGSGAGNGVAAAVGNGVAGPVAAGVSGALPGVSGAGNGPGSGSNVVSLDGTTAEAWLMAAERLAVAEAGKPQKVATARRVAEALAEWVERNGREPSNMDLGKATGLSHTSARNYRVELRQYLPADEPEVEAGAEAVGEG